MAARKSCTHLTWSEAKARSGIATSGQKKNKEMLRKQDHGKVLADKIIAKSGGGVAEAENRKLKKQFRKIEEKNAQIEAQRREEKEQKRLAAMQETKAYDRAVEKMNDKMEELRSRENDPVSKAALEYVTSIDFSDESVLTKIAECKQMQLDEIMALEAMVPEEDFCLCNATAMDELREKLQADDDHAAIAQQSPISYYIKLSVDDPSGDDADHGMDLNAQIILRVTLPPLYLNSEGSPTPLWEVEDVLVTDKNFFCSSDKPLESVAWLEELKLKEAMNQEANDSLLPYPCVYELAVTWLTEHIFEYLKIQSHLLATTTTTAN